MTTAAISCAMTRAAGRRTGGLQQNEPPPPSRLVGPAEAKELRGRGHLLDGPGGPAERQLRLLRPRGELLRRRRHERQRCRRGGGGGGRGGCGCGSGCGCGRGVGAPHADFAGHEGDVAFLPVVVGSRGAGAERSEVVAEPGQNAGRKRAPFSVHAHTRQKAEEQAATSAGAWSHSIDARAPGGGGGGLRGEAHSVRGWVPTGAWAESQLGFEGGDDRRLCG